MSQWYVKEFSKVTDVSVRTLHHYDEIGLLKPSLRTDADYRVYTRADLLRLQQIVAFKSFGLSLNQIQGLLMQELDTIELLRLQHTALKKKVASLQEAAKLLGAIIREGAQSESVEVDTILQLMRVYNMKKQLQKTWLPKVLTPEELDRYAVISSKKQEEITAEEWEFLKELELTQRLQGLMEEKREQHPNNPQKVFDETFGKPSYDTMSAELKAQIFDTYRKGWPTMTNKLCEDMFAVLQRGQKAGSTYLRDGALIGVEVKAHLKDNPDADPCGSFGQDVAKRLNALDAEYYDGYPELWSFFNEVGNPVGMEEHMSEEDKKSAAWIKKARS